MRSIHVPFSFTILSPDYTDSNLYFHILNKLLPGAFLGIAVINAVINRYFEGVLGGVGNSLNTVIIYSFLHAYTKIFKG